MKTATACTNLLILPSNLDSDRPTCRRRARMRAGYGAVGAVERRLERSGLNNLVEASCRYLARRGPHNSPSDVVGDGRSFGAAVPV